MKIYIVIKFRKEIPSYVNRIHKNEAVRFHEVILHQRFEWSGVKGSPNLISLFRE